MFGSLFTDIWKPKCSCTVVVLIEHNFHRWIFFIPQMFIEHWLGTGCCSLCSHWPAVASAEKGAANSNARRSWLSQKCDKLLIKGWVRPVLTGESLTLRDHHLRRMLDLSGHLSVQVREMSDPWRSEMAYNKTCSMVWGGGQGEQKSTDMEAMWDWARFSWTLFQRVWTVSYR